MRATDRNGYSFHFTYDAMGRCIEEHREDGLHRVALKHEPAERRTLVTKADGGVWIYEYDERGTLTRIADPHGGERRWVLDDEGRILEETGPDGKTTLRFLYDEDDNHYGVADALGYIHPPLDEELHPRIRWSTRCLGGRGSSSGGASSAISRRTARRATGCLRGARWASSTPRARSRGRVIPQGASSRSATRRAIAAPGCLTRRGTKCATGIATGASTGP